MTCFFAPRPSRQGFEDAEKQKEFDAFTNELQGEFCCQRDDKTRHANARFAPLAAWPTPAGTAGAEYALPAAAITAAHDALWNEQDTRTKSPTPKPQFPAESGAYAKRICELEGAQVHFAHLARKPFKDCA